MRASESVKASPIMSRMSCQLRISNRLRSCLEPRRILKRQTWLEARSVRSSGGLPTAASAAFQMVSQVKTMLQEGQSIRAIARHFNVCVATIDRIKKTTQLTE